MKVLCHRDYPMILCMYIYFSSLAILINPITSTDSSNDDDEVQFVNLPDLNNTQLENICVERGFELIPNTDPDTGEILEFTRDDYIEAAQQCLDIQAEMDKLLKQNPNIIEELEKERDRMQAKKKQLEAELLAKQNELEDKRKQQGEEQSNPAFLQSEVDSEKEIDMEMKGINELNRLASCEGSSTTSHSIDNGFNNLSHDDEDDKYNSSTEYQQPNSSKKIKPLDDEKIRNNTSAAAMNKKDANHNPLSFKTLLLDTIRELRFKLSKDIQIVSNIIFPPWIREPLIEQIVLPLAKLTRSTGMNSLEILKRYMKVVFEDLTRAQQKQAKQQKQKK